jgi:predicted NUDIX family NTP pyrophosphohydrolase
MATWKMAKAMIDAMKKGEKVSAGLLLYRRTAAGFEVLLAHPGGPFWSARDDGVWTIPKGLPEKGEDLQAAACREFEEETGLRPSGPYLPLGSVIQKSGKRVEAWAWEGDADPGRLSSNQIEIEWPPRSGRQLSIPEVDRYGWFDPATARQKIKEAQAAFIDRLEAEL